MESLSVMKKCMTDLVRSSELANRWLELPGDLNHPLRYINSPGHLKQALRMLAKRIDQFALEADTAKSHKRIENFKGRYFG